MNTLHQLTPLYTAVLAGVAALWLWQVAQSARKSLWPRLGALMPLGLAALLAAPTFDLPVLFGAGAAFVLIAAYWPVMRLRARPRPGAAWLPLALSAVLLMASAQLQSASSLLLALAALLLSAAQVLFALLSPRRPVARPAVLSSATQPFLRRWQGAVTPAVPDLELSLDVDAAKLLNTSGRTLHLAGWSPASGNAWLRTRNASGQWQGSLKAGETAYLTPWKPMSGSPSEGVRLWYVRDGEDATYLFRADWANSWSQADAPEVGERVLN